MSLLDTSKSEPKSSSTITSQQPSCSQGDIAGSASPLTVESAVILLNSLRPKIMEMLGDNQLRVGLTCIDIMRPHRGDLEKAHVMWAGPSHEGEDVQRLKRVCEYIHKEFKKAGLVIDDKRPLKKDRWEYRNI
ncbi:hypothetical protein PHLCEN_2v4842 [Hermanssonia centrifuga]|uniref:A-kinase anchor protein 7-like phosphoesterase domain-containing protein n=1 Tax=Hermanssonia centrifuga TaxID=98765 RepID=A0A2R6PG64_9APHY|nr:hypothetical protein PHLCEN_2v4842 [Hermanssonia centrifuga]